MKPWIYIFITTEKLNFAKMSVTTLLHSHDEISTGMGLWRLGDVIINTG